MFLALDQSKKRTGWAFFREGLDRPLTGHFKLGDELTPPGTVFARLHMELSALRKTLGFESLIYERPVDPQNFGRETPFHIPFVLIGIAAHIDSYCAATGVRRCAWAHAATWRRHFIGSMPRGTKKAALKDFVGQRCRELGMKPRNDDEADACGILDYDLHLANITPPWRRENILTQQLGAVA
jgi:hypothetical protein